MVDIVVSVSMGVMKPLLKKLDTLMGDKYKKLKGVQKEVSFLKRELSDMNALLEKMDDADKLDPQAKNWRKDIIDMSYNIEDYIDDFMMGRVGEAVDNVGILRKASHYLRTFKDQCRLANQFQEIKTLVIEAGERRKRYMLDKCIPSTAHVRIDPRLSALYQKSTSLVGIDKQKEEIAAWVIDERQQLKVMSIVGFGGLGKTTLANEVYREVGGKFNCKAFVSISQNPDIVKLLNSIMLQLGLQPYSHACEPGDLVNKIIKHLQDMRYFIIVDDLWDIRAWNTISCAFPQNNYRSRVMITTRIENVARACCGNHGFIHNMKSLSEKDSRKLFFDRTCESEDACPPNFMEVSSKILKKCGGLPLAIITMASVIACQPTRSKGKWAEYIHNSLSVEFSTNSTYEDMMHIIDLSYKNLPHHLKACFLYLGTYPEDHMISQVELVRRWVAEGFVCCSHGQDVWDVAENCFSELANRSMIQPAYEYHDDIGTNMTHCRVHDMMLELILRKCREDNFISFFTDGPEMMSEEQDKVARRLTIDRRGVEGSITVMGNTRHLSRIRSLSIFGGNCRIRKPVEFKFIRLLYVHVDNMETAMDLTGINHLSQLRYLRVQGSSDKVVLPAQIRGLRHFETLDLSEMFGPYSLPEIIDVPRMFHVSVSWTGEVTLPDWVGKVKSLLTLADFSLTMSSLESISGLGELTALSELIINYATIRDHKGGVMPLPTGTLLAALITSLEKLRNLRTLVLRAYPGTVYCGDALLESPPFRKIERLRLGLFIFSGVPKSIGDLLYLRDLRLCVKHIHQEDMSMIGSKLISLVWLDLWISRSITPQRIVIGASTGFKVLKMFWFDCDGTSRLTFEAGGMPNLQKLGLIIDPSEWDQATPSGLQHLPSLKRIQVVLAAGPSDAVKTEEERRAAKALTRIVFQEAADALPTHPAVDVPSGRLYRPQEGM